MFVHRKSDWCVDLLHRHVLDLNICVNLSKSMPLLFVARTARVLADKYWIKCSYSVKLTRITYTRITREFPGSNQVCFGNNIQWIIKLKVWLCYISQKARIVFLELDKNMHCCTNQLWRMMIKDWAMENGITQKNKKLWNMKQAFIIFFKNILPWIFPITADTTISH